MSIDERMLDILICPACSGAIAMAAAGSGLECRGCGRIYPVRDGIPVMLVEEASAPTDEQKSPGDA